MSAADVYVWAESNSEGHGPLSFEIEASGKKTRVKRIGREWSKNVLRLKRLVPGGLHARVVEYDTPPNKTAEREALPFGAKESKLEVALRAVFEQQKADRKDMVTPWAGQVLFPEYKVTLLNA